MIWLTPWRRGPLLLLRRPAVALALFAAAVVASVPAAAWPMFVSSAGAAAFHARAGAACPWTLGSRVSGDLSVGPDGDAAGYLNERLAEEAEAARSAPRLSPPTTTLHRDDLSLTS
jgi:putative ABC transport system permease protein